MRANKFWQYLKENLKKKKNNNSFKERKFHGIFSSLLDGYFCVVLIFIFFNLMSNLIFIDKNPSLSVKKMGE